jgi:hypothetical protein
MWPEWGGDAYKILRKEFLGKHQFGRPRRGLDYDKMSVRGDEFWGWKVARTGSGCIQWPPLVVGVIYFRVLITQRLLIKSNSQEAVDYFTMNNFRATLQITAFRLSSNSAPHIMLPNNHQLSMCLLTIPRILADLCDIRSGSRLYECVYNKGLEFLLSFCMR